MTCDEWKQKKKNSTMGWNFPHNFFFCRSTQFSSKMMTIQCDYWNSQPAFESKFIDLTPTRFIFEIFLLLSFDNIKRVSLTIEIQHQSESFAAIESLCRGLQVVWHQKRPSPIRDFFFILFLWEAQKFSHFTKRFFLLLNFLFEAIFCRFMT